MNNVHTKPMIYLLAETMLSEEILEMFESKKTNLVGVSHATLKPALKSWDPGKEATNGEILSMIAGKTCYDAIGKGREEPKDYFHNILASGHESVLEHVQFTFLITNISRTFSHEHVRHRIGCAISQRSQRYVNESESSLVMPDIIAQHPKAKKKWRKAVNAAQQAYRELTKLIPSDDIKTARGAARSVLPGGTCTEIVWSANVRALRHYFELRASRFADREIRMVANQIYNLVEPKIRHMLMDLTPTDLEDGTFELIKTELE